MNSLDEVHTDLYFKILKEEALKTYHEIESKLTEPLVTRPKGSVSHRAE